MKVLHYNYSDKGGAANACIRLHNQLHRNDIVSNILVVDKYSNNEEGVNYFFSNNNKKLTSRLFNHFKKYFIPNYYERKILNEKYLYDSFSFPYSLIDITKHPFYIDSEIIHLHNVAYFLDYKSFFKKNKKPVIWTLHDMNPFSGGFHSYGFENFISSDTHKPKRISKYENKILDFKIKVFSKVNDLAVVAPSNWLLNKSKESEVFKKFTHFYIPHGIDIEIFKPYNKKYCKALFGLSADKISVMCIADNFTRLNKGLNFFLDLVKTYQDNFIEFVVVGNGLNQDIKKDRIISIPFINDSRLLPILYSASDITIIPSLQEAFSLTTLESLACGTPVVAFNTTGPKEIISNNKVGYLAEMGSLEDLRNGIEFFVKDKSKLFEYSNNAHIFISKNYDIKETTKEYMKLYNTITRS